MARVFVGIGLLALLAEPALWLARTWIHPGYDSDGYLVALLVGCLILRSVWSGEAPRDPVGVRRATWLLLAAAGVRVMGRILDVSHIGALALVLDVMALGSYLRLGHRPWAINPTAVGLLFGLSMPVEQALQHFLAYPLRLGSAVAAHAVLTPFSAEITRTGTLLMRPDQTLSIDLPCSGAQGLFALGILAFAVACRRVVGLRGVVLGTIAVLAGALVANTTRIVLLFAGPTEVLLQQPAHSVVGLIALSVGSALPLLFATTLQDRRPLGGSLGLSVSWSAPWAAAFATAAAIVALLPHSPVDVSEEITAAALPMNLGDRLGQALPLTDEESAYFDAYGGRVERRVYADSRGTHAALLIQTTQPVRHLHSPANCLRGTGHTVTRLGIRPDRLPTTVWKTVDPDGLAWRVETSLVSATGIGAETVSEVVWHWMREPETTWMLVERVSPWGLCDSDPEQCAAFDAELFATIDLET